jgi:hypothetical protein
LWKIAWNIIPTKVRLKSIFPILTADSLCPLYKSEEDSPSHLFFVVALLELPGDPASGLLTPQLGSSLKARLGLHLKNKAFKSKRAFGQNLYF